jgi:hypothetical protein
VDQLTGLLFRRVLLHLLRFGGLAVLAAIALTACYTDVAELPTPTAGSLSAVTNVPPTQGLTQLQPQPTKAGGGGDGGNQQPTPGGEGGEGGGGGGSPEATGPTAQPTRQVLVGSPPATASRTPVAPSLGTRTPVRPSGTVTPTKPSTIRTVPPSGGTVKPVGVTPPAGKTATVSVTTPKSGTTTAGVTPPPGVTVPSGVTPPPGVTVSPGTGSPVPTGLLLVTKHENFENAIVPGACFALMSGNVMIVSACDQLDGDQSQDPGVIGLEAPAGIYTLHETTPPPGYKPGEDQQVEIVAGATMTRDVINHLIATPASPSAAGEGVVFAQFFGPDGATPLSGVCIGLAGPASYDFCDNGEGDADPSEGSLETGAVTAGDYTLIPYPPAGYEAVEPPATIQVVADQVTPLTLTFREAATPTTATQTPTSEPTTEASPPTEEPTTETQTETPTGEASPPTQEAPQEGVVIVQVFAEDGTTPLSGACLQLTGAATYEACDDATGDADLTPGALELDGVAAGDYALAVTAPANYEPVGELPTTLHVEAGLNPPLTLTFRPVTTTGSIRIDKVDANDGTTPLGGACFDITGPDQTYQICDDAENDADELVGDDATPGVIVIANVVAGDYLIHETQAPEGREPGPDQTIQVVAGQMAQVAVPNGTPATPTLGAIQVAITDEGGNPLPGACLSLVPLFGDGEAAARNLCDGAEDEGPADGAVMFADLAPGSYELRETSAPEGYVTADPVPIDVPVEGGAVAAQLIHRSATGTLTVLAVDAAGNPVAGACFATTLPDGTSRDGCDDDNDGAVIFDGLPPGDYTVTQTSAPAGFEAADVTEQTVTIAAGQPQELRFTVRQAATTGTLVVTKVDAADGTTPLGQACFSVTGADGTPVELCDDDGDGTTRFENLPPGDFTVHETKAPDGYLPAPDQMATVTVGAETPLAFQDQAAPPTGTLTVVTVDPDGVVVPGACYDATGPDGATAQGCDDDNDGSVPLGELVAGDWLVRQSSVPDGYDPSDPAEQMVTVVAGQPVEVPFTVRLTPPAPGALIVTKVAATDGTTALPGACFSVTGADGQAIEQCDDDNDGTIRFADLAAGDYTVHETRAPDGYLPAADQTASVPSGGEIPLTFADEAAPSPGTLTVLAVGPDGNPVPGACFATTLPDGTPRDGCDDDGDGTVIFDQLPAGDYTVTETSAPAGFTAADVTEQTVTVPAGQTVELRFAVQPAAGALVITKVDAADGATALGGACFAATGPDGNTVELCDDDGDGTVRFENLPPGDYAVHETRAPEGYQSAEDQTVSVPSGGEATLNFQNQAIPQTGSVAVTVQDDQGQPVPGACFDVAGPQAVHACDDGENDADQTPGLVLVQNLPPGDYTVTESQVPAGYRGADPQAVTVIAGPDPAPLTFVNAMEPTGVPLSSPVVYTDDAGRLWLLRPNDAQPARLDADDRRFDPSQDPIFTRDRTWVAFLVTDDANPGANMVWVKLDDLSPGGVDFTAVGTPRRIAWLPGSTDTLIVAAQLPSGVTNVFFYRTDTSELSAGVFPEGQEPASVDAIIPAPTGQLVALQATGADGDRDVYIINTADPAALGLTNVGPNSGNDPDDFVAWSPAGDRVLLRSGTDAPLLYVTDAGANAVPLGTASPFSGDANAGTAPQWSPDASTIAFFDNDPAAGGQLLLYGTDGNPRCDPIANIRSADWSPADNRLWALLAPPNEPMRLVAIDTTCGQQDVTTFDAAPDKLLWAPNGGALAIVDFGDAGTVVSLLVGDQLTTVDPASAGVAITDVLAWSPDGGMLALYAGGPTVSLWVVTPGSATPVAVAGSTVPEGASYVTRVWWGV